MLSHTAAANLNTTELAVILSQPKPSLHDSVYRSLTFALFAIATAFLIFIQCFRKRTQSIAVIKGIHKRLVERRCISCSCLLGEHILTSKPRVVVNEAQDAISPTMYPDLIVQTTQGLSNDVGNGEFETLELMKKRLSTDHDDSMTATKDRNILCRNNDDNNNDINKDMDVEHSQYHFINGVATRTNGSPTPVEDENVSTDSCGTTPRRSMEDIFSSKRSLNFLRFDQEDGQLQCALKYDKTRSQLLIHSVCVQLQMNGGNPGFFVEASLLPNGKEFVRSRIYVIADRNVELTLKDVLRLKCTPSELQNATLTVSIKPIIGNFTLYAETDLKDLALNSSSEIYIGGYLRTITSYPN